jgi:hypothetical protein
MIFLNRRPVAEEMMTASGIYAVQNAKKNIDLLLRWPPRQLTGNNP